jgi:hypothetical protein
LSRLVVRNVVRHNNAKSPSAHGRDPLYSHRSRLFEGIIEGEAGVDDDRRDPWTFSERLAHCPDSIRRGQEDEAEFDPSAIAQAQDARLKTRLFRHELRRSGSCCRPL